MCISKPGGIRTANKIRRMVANKVYRYYEKRLQNVVLDNPTPKHLAIIMDGNRRYAEKTGLTRYQGHEMGSEKLEEMLDWCMEIGIKIITVFVFSTENLMRDSEEVEYLMDMFEENFYKLAEDSRVHKYGIRIQVIGQRRLLPEKVRKAIDLAEQRTKGYDQYFLNLAIAYGGREEILQAIKKIAEAVKREEMKPEDITEESFSRLLYTKDHPDPDLILRTSGEERISNFLLWQLAYSELYFADIYWPGFRKIDFLRAIRDYQKRFRRFGE